MTLHVRYTYTYKYYIKYIKDVRNIYLIIGIIKNLGNVANRKIFLFCLSNICNKCKHNNLPLVEAQLQCLTIYVLIIEQGTSSNFSNFFELFPCVGNFTPVKSTNKSRCWNLTTPLWSVCARRQDIFTDAFSDRRARRGSTFEWRHFLFYDWLLWQVKV